MELQKSEELSYKVVRPAPVLKLRRDKALLFVVMGGGSLQQVDIILKSCNVHSTFTLIGKLFLRPR